MTSERRVWRPKLSSEAERDYIQIVDWTIERYGSRQAERYKALIKQTHARLRDDPFAPPTQERADIGAGCRALHLSRPGRHLFIYRVEGEQVLILRILHDSMDLTKHLPDEA